MLRYNSAAIFLKSALIFICYAKQICLSLKFFILLFLHYVLHFLMLESWNFTFFIKNCAFYVFILQILQNFKKVLAFIFFLYY